MNSELEQPPAKKAKTNTCCTVEERLSGIFACSVCLDVSADMQMLQCTNGHLMCACCLMHLLADAKLQDVRASCPSCRCEISQSTCIRNLAVEKAIRELSVACAFCGASFTRQRVGIHEQTECSLRLVGCDLHLLGCVWRGTAAQLDSHVSECKFATMCGADLAEFVKRRFADTLAENRKLSALVACFSVEKYALVDVLLKACRTDDFSNKLFFETGRFTALGCDWRVKAKVNLGERNPHLHAERVLTFQLSLHSRIVGNPSHAASQSQAAGSQQSSTQAQAQAQALAQAQATLDVGVVVLASPTCPVAVEPVLYRFEFTNESTESADCVLSLASAHECNTLICWSAHRPIPLRVAMFQLSK